MNIALSAVIIFLLLLPPIAFYFAFSLGKYPKSGPKIGLNPPPHTQDSTGQPHPTQAVISSPNYKR